MIKKTLTFILVTLIVLTSVACKSTKNQRSIKKIEDLKRPGYRIGYSVDGVGREYVKKTFPQCIEKPYILRVLAYSDLANNKIDAFVVEETILEFALNNQMDNVKVLEIKDSSVNVGFAISEKSSIPGLKNKIDDFILTYRQNNVIPVVFSKWTTEYDAKRDKEKTQLNPDAKWVLKVGTLGKIPPLNFKDGDELSGFDIEIAFLLAKFIGARIEFKILTHAELNVALERGDIDIISASCNIIQNNNKNISFSRPIYQTKNCIIVKEDVNKHSDEDSCMVNPGQLAFKTIGLQRGININIFPEANYPELENYIVFATGQEAIMALKTDVIDSYICHKEDALELLKSHSWLNYLDMSNCEPPMGLLLKNK